MAGARELVVHVCTDSRIISPLSSVQRYFTRMSADGGCPEKEIEPGSAKVI